MSSRIARLIESYRHHIELPWQKGLAGVQKVIFVVYDKTDELKIRYQEGEFENATLSAGHKWLRVDITDDFAKWMAAQEYREGYFEYPEDLPDILGDFNNRFRFFPKSRIRISKYFPLTFNITFCS